MSDIGVTCDEEVMRTPVRTNLLRPSCPLLSDLPGLGEARAWGEALTADLLAYRSRRLRWADIDPGCLLTGPPGTGKTTFAKALAATCQVPIVSASFADWQRSGEGHLGDTLKAMHEDLGGRWLRPKARYRCSRHSRLVDNTRTGLSVPTCSRPTRVETANAPNVSSSFAERGWPVWHMHESIDRLLRLLDAWPRVAIGSSAQYSFVGNDLWRARMDEAFNAIFPRHRFMPWLHMLRGMQAVTWSYPFASVDSTDVARNHHLPRKTARGRADAWDVRQCPAEFSARPVQTALFAAG